MIKLANRFMATQFPIWGADGSRYMDDPTTVKFPNLSIIPDLGGSFISWKATQGAGNYGFVDRTFLQAWESLRKYNQTKKKFIARFPFHFSDYFPSHYTGSAEMFGASQARFFWKTIKGDPGEIKGYLDAEVYNPWGKITFVNYSKPVQIARGFVKEYGYLSGTMPGLYTNPGMLPFFGDFFKDLDLWMSWFNESKTLVDIQAVMKKNSWRGKLRFWQYADDGDLDQDGIGDGLRLGMEQKAMDLNVSLDTPEEFSRYCGQTTIPVNTETTIEDPIINVQSEVKTMTVRYSGGLNVREAPSAGPTKLLTWLPQGTKVNCVETVKTGSDIWRKRKEGGYCAEVFNGFRYLI